MKTELDYAPVTDLDDDAQVDAAIRSAVRETLWDHKRRGQSVVVWQDGRVVTLAPKDIPVDDPAAQP